MKEVTINEYHRDLKFTHWGYYEGVKIQYTTKMFWGLVYCIEGFDFQEYVSGWQKVQVEKIAGSWNKTVYVFPDGRCLIAGKVYSSLKECEDARGIEWRSIVDD